MTKEEQDRLDAAEGKVTSLTATNTKLTTEMSVLSEQVALFSKSQREADVKLLFAATGREHKADDAEAIELCAMSAEVFKAADKFSRVQFSRAPKVAPKAAPDGFENLFSHVAAQGAPTAPQTTPETSNGAGLAANAKQRAEAFSKKHSG